MTIDLGGVLVVLIVGACLTIAWHLRLRHSARQEHERRLAWENLTSGCAEIMIQLAEINARIHAIERLLDDAR